MNLSRNTIRSILVGVIMLTIPCYLVALGFWAISGENPFASATDTPTATRTALPFIDDTGTPTATVTEDASPTPLALETRPGTQIPEFTSAPPPTSPPILPVTNTPFFAATFTPFITNTPAPPTNTPFPTATEDAPPSATRPILLPPTDTPSSG